VSNHLRIQLEGRLERLEASLKRYEAMGGLLGRRGWQRRAIANRETVGAFLASEPEVDAALAHLEHVATRDRWASDTEPLAVATKVAAKRAELQQRLGVASWPLAIAELTEAVNSPRLPGPHEAVLLEGKVSRKSWLWAYATIPTLLGFAMFNGVATVTALAAVAASGIAGLWAMHLGRYVLLVDRLVWIPRGGVPRSLPLSSLQGDGVTLDARHGGVRLEAPRPLSLPVVGMPTELTALLLLFRDGPLKGIDRPPSGTVVLLPASLGSKEGTALLFNEGLCFLPNGAAPAALQAMVPTTLNLPLTEKFLLEQLSRLPSEKLIPLFAKVPGAFTALGSELSVDPLTWGGTLLQMRAGTALLQIPIQGVDLEALRTLFDWV